MANSIGAGRQPGRPDPAGPPGPRRVAIPGGNCWRLPLANRAAVLVDAECYFAAFRAAALGARHSIYIAAWDINSRTPLVQEPTGDGLPTTLGPFLDALIQRRPELHCQILLWDVPLFYATDREHLPVVRFGWLGHSRIRLDNCLPFEAAHHQKIVVIDDVLAFSGGLDITGARWDTRAHLPNDPRRGHRRPYPAFHDVQMMVDGPAAADLGALFRERWRRAFRENLAPPPAGHDPWPGHVAPRFRNVPVAICRTVAPFDGQPGAHEVETFVRQAIATARRWIYIEDQYMTSSVVADALAARLAEPNGPDIAMLLPRDWAGWVEARAMRYGRARVIAQLAAADRFGRLGLYYPDVGGADVKVHSKVTIIDDAILRVGSANLNNRSLGLDTECDLWIEAVGDAAAREGIVAVLHDLLAEHLDVTPAAVAAAMAETGSPVGAIERLRGRPHTLGHLHLAPELEPSEQIAIEPLLVDPKSPFDAERLTTTLLPGARPPGVRRVALKLGAGIAFLFALALAWDELPLRQWLAAPEATAVVAALNDSPAGGLAVVGVFVLGAMVMFPVLAMIALTAVAFEPGRAFAYAMLGCMAAAAAGYGTGYLLGRRLVARLAGRRINRVGRLIRRHGAMTVFLLRIAPVAPFGVINFASGAAHVRFRDYAIGTLLGMTPGIGAMTVLAAWIKRTADGGDPIDLVVAVAIALGLVAAAALTHKVIMRRRVQRSV